mmetsp:Transcript_11238/g.34452  ORF Transcript_11238/g.34452 Transcript_11238/m.34452 type:complete len:209 (+) Transcript_11238:223-849(+)
MKRVEDAKHAITVSVCQIRCALPIVATTRRGANARPHRHTPTCRATRCKTVYQQASRGSARTATHRHPAIPSRPLCPHCTPLCRTPPSLGWLPVWRSPLQPLLLVLRHHPRPSSRMPTTREPLPAATLYRLPTTPSVRAAVSNLRCCLRSRAAPPSRLVIPRRRSSPTHPRRRCTLSLPMYAIPSRPRMLLVPHPHSSHPVVSPPAAH